MADQCRLITPMKFVTIGPEIELIATGGSQLHPYEATVPCQPLDVCHFDGSKCREQRLCYIRDVGFAAFPQIQWRVYLTTIDDHLPTVPGDLKAQHSVLIEVEQQLERSPVRFTSEHMADRTDGLEHQSLHAAVRG